MRFPDFLRRTLAVKRLGRAAAVFVAVLVMTGGLLVTFAAAGGFVTPSSGVVPESLTLPDPHRGDSGVYTKSVLVRGADDTYEDEGPGTPFLAFTWEEARVLADRDGNPVAAHRLNYTFLDGSGSNHISWYDAEDATLVAREPGCTVSVGAGGTSFLDDLFPTTESREEWAHCARYPDPHHDFDWWSFSVPCGIRNPLQGQTTPLGPEMALGWGCQMQNVFSAPPCLRYAPVAVDRVGEFDAVRFVSLNHWGSEDPLGCPVHEYRPPLQYVWFTPELPYPLLLAERDRHDESRFLALRLSSLAQGEDSLLEGADPPSPSPPPLDYAPRQPWGPDDSGIVHTFPLSHAYEAARDNPDDDTMRKFLATHPDAFVHDAHHWYEERHGDVRVSHNWWFHLQGGDERLWVTARQDERPIGDDVHPLGDFLPGAGALPKESVHEFSYERSAGAQIDASQVPDRWPTVESLFDRWAAWPGLAHTDLAPNSYGFRVEQNERETFLVLVAGVALLTDSGRDLATMTGGERERHLQLSRVEFWIDGTATSFMQASSKWERVTEAPPPAPAGPPPPLAPLTFEASDVGLPFRPATFAAGGALLAFLAALAYLVWPAMKALFAFPLFSRIERSSALKHPVRAEVAALVEAEPGIHKREIARRTGRAMGDVAHHLRKLVQLGLVTQARRDGYTCYFPAGKVDRHLIDAAATLKSDGARAVLSAIIERPGATGGTIARATGLTPQTVSHHVARLARRGLVAAEKSGREVRLTAGGLARAALDAVGTP